MGQYNQTTGSGVLVHRGLRVTYRYIDPRNDTRLEGEALVITCSDPNFKAYQDFPETMCGKTPGFNEAVSNEAETHKI